MYTEVSCLLTLKGGVCLSSADTEFQFELNETLYFDDGYHVRELISISLDPEVTIHSYDSYVSIRGEIELRGEYIHEKGSQEKASILELEDFGTKRFIEKVVSTENSNMEFSHRFPVDISVPSYRIHKIDDIQIDIMNFDYELPTNDQLQITALATIHGMKAEIDLLQEQRSKQAENEAESFFEFEIKMPEKDQKPEQVVEEVILEEVALRENEEEEIEETTEILEELPEEIRKEEKESEPEIILEAKDEELRDEVLEDEIKIRPAEEKIKDVSYLADMFRGEEEDKYTRMKICIVQEDDTIETIAERFQVSTLQLIKQNKLDEDFDISEGQLLYIPKK